MITGLQISQRHLVAARLQVAPAQKINTIAEFVWSVSKKRAQTTYSGISPKGDARRFSEYSKQYARRKKTKRHMVNLTSTGRTWSAVSRGAQFASASGSSVFDIFFKGSMAASKRGLSSAGKVGVFVARRKLFALGVTNREMKNLTKIIEMAAIEELRKAPVR
jgi:hypothetical protein